MRVSHPKTVLSLFSVVCLAAALPLLAQSNAEINSGIQFNFSSPGARSLSLGGAFIGLADDATAAYTNPAGLTNLSKPEVFVEGRRFEYKSEYLSGGSADGTPTGIGIDTVPTPIFAKSTSITNTLSFGSIVYPIGPVTLAAYYHQAVDFTTTARTDGAFYDDTVFQGRRRFFPINGSTDVRVSSISGAVAYRFNDQLSVGVGVSGNSYTQNTRVTRFDFAPSCPGANPDDNIRYRCHAQYSADLAGSQETARGDDSDITFSAGVLWKPSRKFSMGMVYRQGPSFTAVVTNDRINGDGTISPILPPNTTGKFHVPDVFGVGFAFMPNNYLTITADYDRVWYSQLTDGLADSRTQGRADMSAYKVSDGNEGHLGIQFALPCGATTFALRVGTWYDPAHAIQYTGDIPSGDNLIFYGGKAVWHGTGGLGLAIGEHFQIDAAGDFSSTVNIGSVSTIIRF